MRGFTPPFFVAVWLRIYAAVNSQEGPGEIGSTIAPGKHAPGAAGEWRRNLDADLRRLRKRGATVPVCPLMDEELDFLDIPNLAERAQHVGLVARRFPFHDGGIPHESGQLDDLLDELVDDRQENARLVIHCRGGLGRSGLVAACLLLRLGLCQSAAEAIKKVREGRGPRAFETVAQEQSVEFYASRPGSH